MTLLSEQLMTAASNTILHRDQSLMRDAAKRIDALEKAVLGERERCATIAGDLERESGDDWGLGYNEACREIAATILERKP